MSDASSYESRLDAVPRAAWDALAGKRIFFGHQSVGQNILDGLRDVRASHPAVRLDIRETADPSDFGAPVFAHAFVGENRNPKSKIDEFRKILEGGVGRLADIVFLKLCFVDIDRTTDVDGLFRYYEDAVRGLAGKFPALKIIHVTVPLTNQPAGLKAMVKKALGRYPGIQEDNIKRNEFNERMRGRYGSAVFDLAAREATSLGGVKASFSRDGRTYDLLQRAYTGDGGHLNGLGRRIAAVDLLGFLTGLQGR